MRLVLIFAAVLLTCFSVGAQHASLHAREAVQTIQELRVIGLPGPHDLRNGLPPMVPGLLRQLNGELKALIIETLNDRARHEVPTEEEIMDQLRAAGWREVPDHKWNAYGEIIGISFDWGSGNQEGILSVSPRLWIPCGNDPDSSIYIFQGRAREWELVLAADSDFDSQSAEPDSGLQYAISPPDSRGKWFLAIAHTPPSCRHSSDTLHYSLLRPGSSPDKPITLLDRRAPVNQEFDPPFRIHAEEDWFALTMGKKRKLDGASAVSICRYEVTGQRVSRTHPLALTPEDFLDEWIQLNWEDAARWSSDFGGAELQNWHSKLSSIAFDSTELKTVQPCPKKDSPVTTTWLIDLWIDRQLNPSIQEEELYAQISQKNGIFYVDGIQRDRPAGCPGSTPPSALPDLRLPTW